MCIYVYSPLAPTSCSLPTHFMFTSPNSLPLTSPPSNSLPVSVHKDSIDLILGNYIIADAESSGTPSPLLAHKDWKYFAVRRHLVEVSLSNVRLFCACSVCCFCRVPSLVATPPELCGSITLCYPPRALWFHHSLRPPPPRAP